MSSGRLDSHKLGGPHPPAATVTYIGGTANTTSQTTYTFTNHAIGGPGLIVVGYAKESGDFTNDPTITIGGNTARLVVYSAGSSLQCGIGSLVVSSGTTATITVSWPGTAAARCQVNVWRIQNYMSDIELDTFFVTNETSTAIDDNIDVLAGGVLIGVMVGNTNSITVTWTGVTENYDASIGGAAARASGGSIENTATEANRLVRAAGTSDNRSLCAASWR